MDREFKPSLEAFYVRLVWLAGPIVMVIILDYWEVLPQPHYILDLVLVVGTTIGLVFAIDLHCQKIKFQKFHLTLTDCFGKEHLFKWNLIQEPLIETKNRALIPSSQVFSFKYHEVGNFKYWLSELSEADRKDALALIRSAFPDIPELVW